MEAYYAPHFVVSYTITDTIHRDGKTYFAFAFRSNPQGARYFRYDSSRYIYEYYPGAGEFLLFDFQMQPGDSIKYGNPPKSAIILLSRAVTVNTNAGIFSDCLYFIYDRLIPAVDDEQYYYFAKNVGLVRYNPTWDMSEYLLGAYVNGRLIGDTTTVGVDDQKAAITNGYALSQNYPNPFTTSTVMELRISRPMWLEASVFDLNGKRLRTLLASNVLMGTRKLLWDGTDDVGSIVPSGIYWVKVTSGQATLTRKVLFLK
jgi:hypothetical protein